MTEHDRPDVPVILRRGLGKRCPHCGRGALFRRGVKLHNACAVCGLRYLRNQGDPWAFLLITDRVFFLVPAIAAIYFGWLPREALSLSLLFGSLLLLFLATMPHRYGLCVALDYLTRRYWPDPDDRLPDPPPDA